MEDGSCSVEVIATTHADFVNTKENFDKFGGMAAGVCYMQSTFDQLRTEAPEKTARRVKMTKENAHHSVYDHCGITLFLCGIPRVIECMLNNERMMTSSVKSGRYTRHALGEDEGKLYDKWLEIFKSKIREKYQNAKGGAYFTDSRVEKLAMENARYLTSVFTPISMIHTLSYRQLNYVYGFIRDFEKKPTDNDFVNKLKPYLRDFLTQLEGTGYIDGDLMCDGKNRILSLFHDGAVTEYFGDVYATQYRASFAYFCHANRHRTLKHHIGIPPEPGKLEFYVPEILVDDKALVKQWHADLDTLRDQYPQAMLLNITEMGAMEDFVLKVYERKCSAVLLETMRATNMLLGKYAAARPELKGYTKGARCTFDGYKCPSPCGFGDGITEKRKI